MRAAHKSVSRPWLSTSHWLWPLALGVPFLFALQVLDLDRAASAFFYDPMSLSFPLRNDWWLTHVFHDGAKWTVIGFGFLVFAAWLLSFVWAPLRCLRRLTFFLICGIGLTAAGIAVIKAFSSPACPYDLTIYGGLYPRLTFFERLPAGTSPGRCWPGGHASTAFSLFGLYFAARHESRSRLAFGLLLFVLLFGALLSVVQVMRGAHFPSHQMWTALICWYITAGVYNLVYGRPHTARNTAFASRRLAAPVVISNAVTVETGWACVVSTVSSISTADCGEHGCAKIVSGPEQTGFRIR